nr:immunoglobulin heavy chain junction region [Mus musculus]MBK4195249.1 immunoglobulin heavy chain junction region [Mus musculus]
CTGGTTVWSYFDYW